MLLTDLYARDLFAVINFWGCSYTLKKKQTAERYWGRSKSTPQHHGEETSGIILFPDGTPTGEAAGCEITF